MLCFSAVFRSFRVFAKSKKALLVADGATKRADGDTFSALNDFLDDGNSADFQTVSSIEA